MLLPRSVAPDSQRPRPVNGTRRGAAIDSFDSDRKATLVALDDCASIGETLDGLHELIAVPLLRRVEVECVGVTQVAFRNQVGEHQNLMARPVSTSLDRQHASRRHMIAYLQAPEMSPAIQGQERVLRGRDDGMTQRRPQSPDRLHSAFPHRDDMAPTQAQRGIARNRALQMSLPRDQLIDRHPTPRLAVHYPSLTHDALRKSIFTEAHHLLINTLRKVLTVVTFAHSVE